ncbi:RNA methyltransferase substrate-binding domain-containing protein [Brachybacterium sp. Z12]|uniref:RNA methyltransferase substrate-binding domain-containing protein n=1 Tax=Brachybacterium sp. Z12 TaxID=2759167 RepID=UPI00223B1AC9|nr:RNA methyltransferase substrate-binding domain-containing protein [Brachybacterium sp. Z12]
MAALTGRSARRRQGRFRIEGPLAVHSLLEHRSELALEVFLTERADADHPELRRLARRSDIPLRVVDEQILRAMLRDQGPGQEGGAADGAP